MRFCFDFAEKWRRFIDKLDNMDVGEPISVCDKILERCSLVFRKRDRSEDEPVWKVYTLIGIIVTLIIVLISICCLFAKSRLVSEAVFVDMHGYILQAGDRDDEKVFYLQKSRYTNAVTLTEDQGEEIVAFILDDGQKCETDDNIYNANIIRIRYDKRVDTFVMTDGAYNEILGKCEVLWSGEV